MVGVLYQETTVMMKALNGLVSMIFKNSSQRMMNLRQFLKFSRKTYLEIKIPMEVKQIRKLFHLAVMPATTVIPVIQLAAPVINQIDK